MPFRVLLGVAENLQFEEQIFYRQHLRCFGKRQWEKILSSALEGPAKTGPFGLGYLFYRTGEKSNILFIFFACLHALQGVYALQGAKKMSVVWSCHNTTEKAPVPLAV